MTAQVKNGYVVEVRNHNGGEAKLLIECGSIENARRRAGAVTMRWVLEELHSGVGGPGSAACKLTSPIDEEVGSCAITVTIVKR